MAFGFPSILSATATLVSCATRSSTDAAALKPTGGSMADLRSYQSATVVPFKMTGSHTEDPGVGKRFAADIGLRLKNDFGPLFKEVRVKDQPLKKSSELVVTGTISKYEHRLFQTAFIPKAFVSNRFCRFVA